jgi:AraC family transcriptional regulator, transcriptional activator FtrA
MRSCDHRRVATLLYDGLSIFEFGIVVEIFGLPRPELEVDWYKFETCSHQRGPLRTTGGVRVEARRGIAHLATGRNHRYFGVEANQRTSSGISP